MKKYIIFAGVNGACKSTLYQIKEIYQDIPRINGAINGYIAHESLIINLDTKIASQSISTFKYGVNSISFSWNSIIFKLDAGMVELLAKAGAAGAVAIIVGAFPPLVAFIAANPVLGLAVGAVVASIVDSIISSGIIKDGVEIHYNFFLFRVTVIRKQ